MKQDLLEIKKTVEFRNKVDIYFSENYFTGTYKINKDLTVQGRGDIWWQRLDITELPVKIKKFKGALFVGHNKLTSTEGFPLGVDRIECHCNAVMLYRPEGYTGLFYNCKLNHTQLRELTLEGDFLDDKEQKLIHGHRKSPTTRFY